MISKIDPSTESNNKEIDYIKLRPTFTDFNTISNDPRSYFPYKSIVLSGNYSELITKVIRPRGFTKVLYLPLHRSIIKKVMISLPLLLYGNLHNSNLL